MNLFISWFESWLNARKASEGSGRKVSAEVIGSLLNGVFGGWVVQMEGYAFSSVQETATVEPKNAQVLSTCHQLLMQLPSTPHDLPNLVISTSSQTTTHQLHISCSSYWIHIMALQTSNFLKVLLHACYHPHLPVSFLCFAVKAGHWFSPR